MDCRLAVVKPPYGREKIDSHLVSVILPTKNEEKNIAQLLKGISISMEGIPYEVLVVDDSDNNLTMMLAIMNGARFVFGQHKGLGQAIIDGIKEAKGRTIVVLDADWSHDPAKIPELVKACNNGYDMAIGSRYCKSGSIVGWTVKRKIISKVASLIALPITRIKDNTSGFFAFNASILDGAVLNADSWKIMLEVLVKTGAKAVEIPIEFKDRQAGKSKFKNKEIYAYLKHLFKLALYRYRILSFMLVGGIGYFVNMVVYYPLTLWFKEKVLFLGQEFYLPPFLISSFIAITSNFYLNRLSTFKDYKEKDFGYVKYLTTCSASLPIEMVLIFLFVRFLGVFPVLAVALAILIVFIARYAVVSRIVWHRK